jgi:hypothetical protein
VYAKVHTRNDSAWLPGNIVRVSGPVSYVIELNDGRQQRCHVDQIIARIGPLDDESATEVLDNILTTVAPPATHNALVPAVPPLVSDSASPPTTTPQTTSIPPSSQSIRNDQPTRRSTRSTAGNAPDRLNI